ncbi:MAG: YybH family protein [Longimicrobiales bacterium]
MRKFVLCILLLGHLTGCRGAPTPEDRGTIDSWRAELMAADRAFNEATANLGASGWASFFAPEGAMISEGVGEIRGPAAIETRMEGAFSDSSFRLSWEPIRAEVSEGGDLGYTVGRYRSLRLGNLGQEVRDEGLYVSIWRRQDDGTWKVEMDLGSSTSS